jgi:hypothetical protein
VCNNNLDIKYKLPNELDCDDIDVHTKNISLNLYKLNDDTYISDAFLIKIKKITCNIYRYLFKTDEEKITYDNEYKSIEDYRSINSSLVLNINDEIIKLNKISDYKFIHKADVLCHRKLFSDSVRTSIGVSLSRGHVYIRNDEMSSSLLYAHNCVYDSQKCSFADGSMLIWNKNKNYVSNEFKFWKSINDAVIIKDTSNNLNIITRTEHIGLQIPNITDFVTVKGCGKCVRTTIPLYAVDITNVTTQNLKKNKRDTFNDYINEELAVVKNEIKRLCDIENKIYELLIEICKISPILCAKKLLNTSHIDAKIIDDYLIVSHCTPVIIKNFKSKKINNKCSLLIPVEYEYNNKLFTGYYDRVTSMIHHHTVVTDSDCVGYDIINHNSKFYLYNYLFGNFTEINKSSPNIEIVNDSENINPRNSSHYDVYDVLQYGLEFDNIIKIINLSTCSYNIVEIVILTFVIIVIITVIYLVFSNKYNKYFEIKNNDKSKINNNK